MNKRLQFVPVLILLTTISMAQVPGAVEKNKKGCSCGYSALYNVGVLSGEAGESLQLQTIQGIRYGQWFSGIGVGLDFYHLRGIPVFLDIRRTILKGKNAPFIYADGGVHFPWARKKDKAGFASVNYDNGLFYDLGLGYKVAMNKKGAILLSAGYSYKYMEEKRFSWTCFTVDCINNSPEYFKYKLNRLSLKLGVQL
jgi:hypothetical protein